MTASQRRRHTLTACTILGIALICAALLFRPGISRAQEHVGYAMGGCGGLMTGYDGRQYRCEQDRLPVCNQNRQQCVCLARRECGAKQNEPY
jgi:hypothetical protein